MICTLSIWLEIAYRRYDIVHCANASMEANILRPKDVRAEFVHFQTMVLAVEFAISLKACDLNGVVNFVSLPCKNISAFAQLCTFIFIWRSILILVSTPKFFHRDRMHIMISLTYALEIESTWYNTIFALFLNASQFLEVWHFIRIIALRKACESFTIWIDAFPDSNSKLG